MVGPIAFDSCSLVIDGTNDEDRSENLYDLIVVVNPEFARKLKNKEYVVVLR